MSNENSICLRSTADIQQFKRMCDETGGGGIQEVAYCCHDLYEREQGVYGWVPPSVKSLKISVSLSGTFVVPDTVEKLSLDHCGMAEFVLPDSVKELVLEPWFSGQIKKWPASLEKLVINGWFLQHGAEPIRLDNLPDTISTMFLTWGTAVEVRKWPAGLKCLIMESSEDDSMASWLGIRHADLPDVQEFKHTVIGEDYEVESDEEETAGLEEDESEGEW
jgi:hypothetical protein